MPNMGSENSFQESYGYSSRGFSLAGRLRGRRAGNGGVGGGREAGAATHSTQLDESQHNQVTSLCHTRRCPPPHPPPPKKRRKKLEREGRVRLTYLLSSRIGPDTECLCMRPWFVFQCYCSVGTLGCACTGP